MSSSIRLQRRAGPPRFCGACGWALPYQIAFCQQCGKSVADRTGAAPAPPAPFARGGDPGMVQLRRSDLRFVYLNAPQPEPAVGWAERVWVRFRRLPPLGQIALWVLGWWALAIVLIWRSGWSTPVRWAATTAVVVVTLMLASAFSEPPADQGVAGAPVENRVSSPPAP